VSYFDHTWKELFTHHLPWDDILPLYYPEFPTADGYKNKEEIIASFCDILDATGSWSQDTLAPRAKIIDKVGAGELKDGRTIPSEPLQASYQEATELGILALTAAKEFGGMELPAVVNLFLYTQIHRACIGTGTQISFFTSIADMVERFCPKEVAQRIIPRIIAGELSGSMNLTEPGAGSDVGSLKTSALRQENGTYLLNGAKIFITNGGGGIGFVLARVKGAPEGLKGISLFFIEQFPEGTTAPNYLVTKIEEKMGMHSSFTCEVVYENSVAHLVGEEGQGIEYMFHLMNESRIGVGLQAISGLEACLSYVRQYAETRVQFGKTLLELPLYAYNLKNWEIERDAFRCLMVDTYGQFDIYAKIDLMQRHGKVLSKDEAALFSKAKKICRLRTPLVKYYGAETYTTLSQKCIQALGGYGFIAEYEAERFHRDSFAPLLYEGTSQIQALMALKDLFKFISKSPMTYIKLAFTPTFYLKMTQ
jgi:alkylation response protein AidB-like acyl-CoA dehydrogenase